MHFRHFIACAAFSALAAGTPAAIAQSVAVVGLFPSKVVVQIDGGAPRTISVGQKTGEGVRLVSIERDRATFEIKGQRKTLRMGQQHITSTASDKPTVLLSADTVGHFVAEGQINGGAIRFIVDTGATVVSLSSSDAQRLGIEYRSWQPVRMTTANGIARGYRVKLDTVRIGSITANNVDAVVLQDLTMPALLGMSFLNRMEMRRDGQTMTLIKRY